MLPLILSLHPWFPTSDCSIIRLLQQWKGGTWVWQGETWPDRLIICHQYGAPNNPSPCTPKRGRGCRAVNDAQAAASRVLQWTTVVVVVWGTLLLSCWATKMNEIQRFACHCLMGGSTRSYVVVTMGNKKKENSCVQLWPERWGGDLILMQL